MVVGKSVVDGVDVSLICTPAENPDEKLKFKIVFGDDEQEFSEFGSAIKAFLNFEHTGMRSFTT